MFGNRGVEIRIRDVIFYDRPARETIQGTPLVNWSWDILIYSKYFNYSFLLNKIPVRTSHMYSASGSKK
jgi:hypothetical protein